ncbi:hypothetical protein IZ6_08720 [Terrihabitans soli]|uniref:Uncharacterized protein n=2 Tax=Terrihabitans soli TaxID=708113 RepID=A0A6S6QQ95_9HYPH|nr:hypothetical protein IZ6_08720 [Terrihabitans soli]
MYRVLAIVLLAYAICYPRVALEASANPEPFGRGPTRAERLMADFSAWLDRPIEQILATLNRSRSS